MADVESDNLEKWRRATGNPVELRAAVAALDWTALKRLIADLKRAWQFGVARKVLEEARRSETDPGRRPWLLQQLALCTYKDVELPPTRFNGALAILEEIGLRHPQAVDSTTIDPSTLPETLALGGAIYKRKWELEGQIEHLQQSLALYLAAWRCDPVQDLGYGGANAAYILDTLAMRAEVLARRTSAMPDSVDLWKAARRFRRRARALRVRISRQLEGLAEARRQQGYTHIFDEYWYRATHAELHFGLGQYAEAGAWLARAREALGPPTTPYAVWEIQSTFVQLLGIARAQGVAPPSEDAPASEWAPAWQALQPLLQEATGPALGAYAGRIGLALSGGGFRASLFHIGVLARLAETDLLRRVEVLSTVSGGSIVGAHYYLLLKQLLESTPDGQIDREAYIRLVGTLHDQFAAAIRQNLRIRTLTHLIKNLRMFALRTYSRSRRLGELYEDLLYSRVEDGHARGTAREMRRLLIVPHGADASFKPAFSNWSRRAKVPALLLNATSLNSGHNWQFTGRWMGEPPGLLGAEVDVNERYRRLWYDQAPTPALQRFPLGQAVAASACVPGLFDPLVLEQLYPGRTVRLVDGGVHDNQGVAALINEGCTLILCSDASGQMQGLERPGDGLISVPFRCNNILMSRVREAEYQDLRARVDSRALRGLMFLHLKKGLEAQPLDWIGCQDPTVPPARSFATTDYGVDTDLQRKLAGVRTDLDSFTEVEANALMLSGYLMTEHELKQLQQRHHDDGEPGGWGGGDVTAGRREWPFLKLELLMRQPPESSDVRRRDLGRQLDVASQIAFKIWRLSPALRATALAAGAALLVAAGWFIRDRWDQTLQVGAQSFSYRALFLLVALTIGGSVFPILQWIQPTTAMRGYFRKALVAVVGCVACNVHLWTFDRLFLKRGTVKRLLELE